MHSYIAIAAGLVAVAYAGTTTITDTVDVTITSCEPTVTNCPYKDPNNTGSWDDWATTTDSTPVADDSTATYDPTWSDWTESTSTPVAAASSSSWDPTWSDWDGSTSVPVAAASATTGTWSDWVGTSSWTTATPVNAASGSPGWGAGSPSSPVAAASTSLWSSYPGSATGVAPATYTGAANANAASYAFAGLAAAAALVIA